MAIDNIGLLAQQTYTQIQDRPKLDVAETPMNRAADFHDIVNKQFNSFAKMSPAQILNHIQGARQSTNAVASSGNSSGILSNTTRTIREPIANQEDLARKSLIGEASLVELMTATTEAKNTMDTAVKVRDKFLEAFDKVMNMSM